MSVPSVGMGAVVRVPVAPRLARGLHVPRGRGKGMPRGSGILVLTLWGSGEAEIVPDRAQGSGTLMALWGSGEVETTARGAYLARDLSARLRRDEGWLSDLERLTCCQRLWRVSFTGALRWGFSRCARCHISSSVGYPGISIPDKHQDKIFATYV
jgi:hypothetical protein